MEMVEGLKFVGINIMNNLACTNHIEAMAMMAHQHLCFHIRIRTFGTSPMTYPYPQIYCRKYPVG